MNGSKLFLDTNIVLYFLNGDSEIVEIVSEADPLISFVTELELLSFPNLTEIEEKQIIGFIENCQLIDLSSLIKKNTIALRKKYNLRLPDAIIAASSNYFNVPLVTADKRLSNIEELKVIKYEP